MHVSSQAGVGYTRNVFLKKGDEVIVEVEGVGLLRNIVAVETDGEGIEM